ncbi:hypothetical protein PF005_g25472 [Phytophthora fragariae]|uniref:Uncharacterized protein n=1 Tax=Phytophthora fragariae TaxID=53985 RepID=A0A6A3R9J7_9STRA|nr:hypothetical protein PF003_g25074 [Phytophthora fragariae]KAE8923566.1 hypothetical protein PF009_g26184 [Phytophthora fragariae]KAE8977618.1 hypothetical protein PF011_g23581 [Phytophthora fragariae]KAE9075578.1 hypothetical protein PF010_g24250 [Phytophthora fragariae]KAE9075866.1 hypothetical protein PF007_g24837 [Phytophthora fragariae]
MSFLLGDDYASSSDESESDAEEQVATPTEKQEDNVHTQLLPSADSVLSSVSASTASFLAPKSSAKLATSVKAFDLLEERETQRREQDKEERGHEQEQEEVETRRNERKRPPPAMETASREQSAKREKKDAKERVKNQRVKGQAGIGSDFRGWKSETEMALRQQFA